MFSSKSKDSVPVNVSAISPSPAPKRVGRPGAVPSIVSADLTVTGTLNTSGDMQVDGNVEGDVRSVGLVIGERAEIRGEIWAEDVTVRGRVIGRIYARKILLAATAHVEGDILHEAFAVEAGAFFEGSCRRSDNPLGEDVKANVEIQRPLPHQAAPQTPQPIQTSLAGLAPLQAT